VGSDVAVIPCHLEGGFRAWPKGKRIPRPRRLSLRIGEGRDYKSLDKTAESVKSVCTDLQAAVAGLGSTAK
jgi:hypothetical protein